MNDSDKSDPTPKPYEPQDCEADPLAGIEISFLPSGEPLASTLYERYCLAVGGKAFNGDPLPSWGEFREDSGKAAQADAWVAVADAAHEAALPVVNAMRCQLDDANIVNIKLMEEADRLRGGRGFIQLGDVRISLTQVISYSPCRVKESVQENDDPDAPHQFIERYALRVEAVHGPFAVKFRGEGDRDGAIAVLDKLCAPRVITGPSLERASTLSNSG